MESARRGVCGQDRGRVEVRRRVRDEARPDQSRPDVGVRYRVARSKSGGSGDVLKLVLVLVPGYEGTDSRTGPTTRERMETMPGFVLGGQQVCDDGQGPQGGLGSGGGSHAHRTSGQARSGTGLIEQRRVETWSRCMREEPSWAARTAKEGCSWTWPSHKYGLDGDDDDAADGCQRKGRERSVVNRRAQGTG
ncbi:hypothetical protein C8035_v000998 [Colletotrichum spinosum]|uniref:Uncharacterized protein n=1 Tax=Colletotrichum spinosum TaxID=1347390 RepID=A0A4R8Q9F5_9PEZI|nr:hypothetical protein C8035_v000998 [Colletotrichum spinosum]